MEKGRHYGRSVRSMGLEWIYFFILTIDGPLQEPSSERKTASGVPQGVPQTYVGRGGCGAGLSD